MPEALWIFLSSWTLCTLAYFLLGHALPRRSDEWCCRLVTITHAICVTIASGWCSLIHGPWPFTHAGGPNIHMHTVIMSASLGYFVFDFAWCMWFHTEGPAMLAHHLLSIVGLSVALSTGYYGTEVVATIFGSEISNPILQTRWFLKELGRYKSFYGDVVDVLFVTSFTIMRFGLGSYLLYTYFSNPRTNFLGRFGGVCFYAVSILLWISILQFAWHRYHTPASARVKNLSTAKSNCDLDQGSLKSLTRKFSGVSNGHLGGLETPVVVDNQDGVHADDIYYGNETTLKDRHYSADMCTVLQRNARIHDNCAN